MEPLPVVPTGRPYTNDELTRIARHYRQEREVRRMKRRWQRVIGNTIQCRGGRTRAEAVQEYVWELRRRAAENPA
jgi:hypothetical protein